MVLAGAQDRIDKTWISRLRKTWKGYVGRAKSTGYMQADPFLQNGIDWLLALADDMAFNKGFFTFLRSKKEETEVYKIRVKAMEHLRQAAKELEAAQREIKWWDEVFTPGTRNWKMGAGHRYSVVRTEAAKEGIDVLSSEQADQVLLDNPQIGERILSKQTRAWLMEGVGKADSEFNRKFLSHLTRVINKWKSDIEFGTAEREFNVGNVKVVMLDLQGPFPQEREDKRNPFLAVPAYLKQLQKAEALLRQKGLGFLWYGPMFVKQRSAGGKNRLGEKFGLGAHYEPGRDIVVIYNDPTAGLYRLIAHELGHRYYYKFMNSTQRAEFNAMFGDVPAVSEYGGTIAEEDFAEVFSYYIDNRNLTRDQLERLKRFLTSKGKRASAHPRAKLPLFKVDRFKQYPPRASEILKSADRQVYFPFEGRHGQPNLYYGDEAKTPDGAIQNGQKAVRQYQKDTWPGGMGEVVAIAYMVRNGKLVYRPVWNSYYSFS